MNDQEFEKRKEEEQILQRNMMLRFKGTPEYTLLRNIVDGLKIMYAIERKKEMKKQSLREMSFYYNGREDMCDEFWGAIDKAIADGNYILSKNDLLAEAEKGE